MHCTYLLVDDKYFVYQSVYISWGVLPYDMVGDVRSLVQRGVKITNFDLKIRASETSPTLIKST